MSDVVVQVHGLDFRYGAGQPLALRGLGLELRAGQRVLLVGANGAGKTTLLRVLGGKHMVDREAVRVLGRPAFHDTTLAADVCFIGGSFPVELDVRVSEMLAGSGRYAVDPARQARLIEVLGVDRDWRMHRVSDGQRRRVQLLLALQRPSKLLLMDEITTDLDILVRADLLAFLKEECEARGVTIAYATHIFDGLEDWATDLAVLEKGWIVRESPLGELEELAELRNEGMSSPLYRLVERWLRHGVSGSPLSRG
ncbi:MAG: ATP-binding cassette domain-containing protein [bacterium]